MNSMNKLGNFGNFVASLSLAASVVAGCQDKPETPSQELSGDGQELVTQVGAVENGIAQAPEIPMLEELPPDFQASMRKVQALIDQVCGDVLASGENPIKDRFLPHTVSGLKRRWLRDDEECTVRHSPEGISVQASVPPWNEVFSSENGTIATMLINEDQGGQRRFTTELLEKERGITRSNEVDIREAETGLEVTHSRREDLKLNKNTRTRIRLPKTWEEEMNKGGILSDLKGAMLRIEAKFLAALGRTAVNANLTPEQINGEWEQEFRDVTKYVSQPQRLDEVR